MLVCWVGTALPTWSWCSFMRRGPRRILAMCPSLAKVKLSPITLSLTVCRIDSTTCHLPAPDMVTNMSMWTLPRILFDAMECQCWRGHWSRFSFQEVWDYHTYGSTVTHKRMRQELTCVVGMWLEHSEQEVLCSKTCNNDQVVDHARHQKLIYIYAITEQTIILIVDRIHVMPVVVCSPRCLCNSNTYTLLFSECLCYVPVNCTCKRTLVV